MKPDGPGLTPSFLDLTAKRRAACWGDDLNLIDDLADSVNLGDDRLGHLLQVIGGHSTAKPCDSRMELARKAAQGEVTTAAKSALDFATETGFKTGPWGRRKLAIGEGAE